MTLRARHFVVATLLMTTALVALARAVRNDEGGTDDPSGDCSADGSLQPALLEGEVPETAPSSEPAAHDVRLAALPIASPAPAAPTAVTDPPGVVGRVVGLDGKPVADVRVVAWKRVVPARAKPVPICTLLWSRGEARSTQLDGSFTFRALRRGDDVALVVESDDWAPLTVVASGDADLVLRLTPSPRPTITVLDADGKPIASARVRVTGDLGPSGGTRQWWTTDASGRVRLGGLSSDAGYQLTALGGDAGPGSSRAQWSPADTVVRLERWLSVEGVVRDEAGRERPDAIVWGGAGGGPYPCDGHGRFVVPKVAPGTGLRASLRGEETADDFLVESGYEARSDTTDAVLRVTVGAELHVTGLGERDALLRFAWLLPEDRAAGTRGASVLPDGTARFRQVPPGVSYALWIHDPDHGRYVLRPQVTAPATLDVRWEEGRSIHVRFAPRAAGAPDDAHIILRAKRGLLEVSPPFDGLPAGRWRVTALGANAPTTADPRLYATDPAMWSAEADVDAGSDVVLELRPPARR